MKNLIIILSIILSLSCSSHSGRRVEQKKQIQTEKDFKKRLRCLDQFSSITISIDTTLDYLTIYAMDTLTDASYNRTYKINASSIDMINLYPKKIVDEYIIISPTQ